MIIYRGGRRQRGYGIGGVFSSFFREALPVLEKGAKIVGKNAVNFGVKVANDAIQGKDITKSLEQHGRNAATDLIGDVAEELKTGKKRKREVKKVIPHRAKRQRGRGFTDIFDNHASD